MEIEEHSMTSDWGQILRKSFTKAIYAFPHLSENWHRALKLGFTHQSPLLEYEHLKTRIILHSGISVHLCFSCFLSCLIPSPLLSFPPPFPFSISAWLTRGLDKVETSLSAWRLKNWIPDKELLSSRFYFSTEKMVCSQTTILAMVITFYSSTSLTTGTLSTSQVKPCLSVEAEKKAGLIVSAETNWTIEPQSSC